MPTSLPHALSPADFVAVPAPSAPQRNAVGRISGWLKQAEQRRAQRLLADAICASGIEDFGGPGER